MLLTALQAMFERDLTAMERELDAYDDEATIWAAVPGHPNSGGALVRHVCGNLQHFLGAVLNASGYQRQRDAEFAGPPSRRADLLAELRRTRDAVGKTLRELPQDQLEREYPLPFNDARILTSTFLVHLAVHCAFHLGQIDYHRRVVTGDARSVAPMGLGALATGPAA